jgi:hypothetical protein
VRRGFVDIGLPNPGQRRIAVQFANGRNASRHFVSDHEPRVNSAEDPIHLALRGRWIEWDKCYAYSSGRKPEWYGGDGRGATPHDSIADGQSLARKCPRKSLRVGL